MYMTDTAIGPADTVNEIVKSIFFSLAFTQIYHFTIVRVDSGMKDLDTRDYGARLVAEDAVNLIRPCQFATDKVSTPVT